MSKQKPLCIICELPTADGGIPFAQMDRKKLKTWLPINCGGKELPKNVKDKHLICYFCIWQAEFLAIYVYRDESLAWWPKNIKYDRYRKQLRKNFLEGNADQCWVQLKVIDLPKSEKETEKIVKKAQSKVKKMCVYCCFEFNLSDLRDHTEAKHKDFIKCDIKKCINYFLKTEDKKKHMQECHANPPKKQTTSKRSICDVEETVKTSEIPEKTKTTENPNPELTCPPQGCDQSSQTETEKQEEPVLPSHEEDKEDAKKLKLDSGDEKAVPPVQESSSIRCTSCEEKFSAVKDLMSHFKTKHMSQMCIICNVEIVPDSKVRHNMSESKCSLCQESFKCSALLQSHWKKCPMVQFKCKECPRAYQHQWQLEQHVLKAHTKRPPGNDTARTFKCEPCQRFFESDDVLKIHLRDMHTFTKFLLVKYVSNNK
ncbi:zinc finger protein 64-like [Cloeon dipterum]|uniref:zinc finger protein 64-like n=1 Tax=Cloeon dipterum TaxID=197152 RepID=UPI00321F8DA4